MRVRPTSFPAVSIIRPSSLVPHSSFNMSSYSARLGVTFPKRQKLSTNVTFHDWSSLLGRGRVPFSRNLVNLSGPCPFLHLWLDLSTSLPSGLDRLHTSHSLQDLITSYPSNPDQLYRPSHRDRVTATFPFLIGRYQLDLYSIDWFQSPSSPFLIGRDQLDLSYLYFLIPLRLPLQQAYS